MLMKTLSNLLNLGSDKFLFYVNYYSNVSNERKIIAFIGDIICEGTSSLWYFSIEFNLTCTVAVFNTSKKSFTASSE